MPAASGRIRGGADRLHPPIGRPGPDQEPAAGAAEAPLWDRLARDNRLIDETGLGSSVRVLRPHDTVVARWRRVIAHAYAPEHIFARFTHQIDATCRHRIGTPARGELTSLTCAAAGTWAAISSGISESDPVTVGRSGALRRSQIEAVFDMGFVCCHLIRFTRDALAGRHTASFYDAKTRGTEAVPTQERA